MAGSPAGKPKMAANPKTPSATPSKSQTSIPLLPSTVSSKYDPGGMVTLLVGPDEEVMLAYEHYISQRSDFSKAALKKEWNEGQTRIIKLPEEHPSNVANYLDFAYGRGLVIAKIDQKSLDYKPTLDPSLIGSSYILADLYLLGERILDPGIQNAVTEEVIRIDSLRLDKGALHFPSATFVKKIYTGTTPKSPMRRLIVDIHVSHGTSAWLGEHVYKYAYLKDLAMALTVKAERKELPSSFRLQKIKAQDYLV